MAGRKDKNTVDYFPHFVESGKSLFIIESKFDNGYKLWFKTLELLGKSENHFIDLRDDMDLLFLISKLKTTEQELTSFYDLLAKLNSIDTELWENKIIFSENFSENIKDAYKRRLNKCMNKSQICEYLSIKCKNNSNSSLQKSTKKSKVEKSKVNKTIEFDIFWNLYDKKIGDKNGCIKKWGKLAEKTQLKIIEILPEWKNQFQDKQFQPYPATFLNQERWNDEDEIKTNKLNLL